MIGFMGPRVLVGNYTDGLEIQTYGLTSSPEGLVRIPDKEPELYIFVWLLGGQTERAVTVMTHMGAWTLNVSTPIGLFKVSIDGEINLANIPDCSCGHLELQPTLRANSDLKLRDADWLAVEFDGGHVQKVLFPKSAPKS